MNLGNCNKNTFVSNLHLCMVNYVVPDQQGRLKEFYDKHKLCSDYLKHFFMDKEVLTKC